jgi:hypothetical protein
VDGGWNTTREVDREVKDMLNWWDVIGLDKDMTVEEMRVLGITDRDGVPPEQSCLQMCCHFSLRQVPA